MARRIVEPARHLALFTDLYELTMIRGYFETGMTDEAVFSLFVRKMPERRNFFLAAGLDDALAYLENLYFAEEDLDYLDSLGLFDSTFLDWLRHFRFTGDVYAVPEGTPVFADEPLVEVVAPIAEAQLAETCLMNQIHLQTVLASKAVRVVHAAGEGRQVVDFGARRMHGIDAAIKAARAFHIAGVAATSNVLAGKIYGVPVTGTMAHSFIQAFDDEEAAFDAFTRVYPETVLLVDTYDTLQGVRRVCHMAARLGDKFGVRAVRLDSGDLTALAKEARRILDDAGLEHVAIFASGGLDEYGIAEMAANDAPITGFGVGTAMGVSKDVPALDIAYKLVAYGGEGRLKLSTGKGTLPGRKQIYRLDGHGIAERDVLARVEESQPGRPLMQCVMKNGKRTPAGRCSLQEIRDTAKDELSRLPARLQGIADDHSYEVHVSAALKAYHDEVAAKFAE